MIKDIPPITVAIINRQRKISLHLSRIRQLVAHAIPSCITTAKRHRKRASLPRMLEASVVSDRIITQVHGEFLGENTPTDVITFPYGEILVSAETAKRNARSYQHTLEEELALYIIHGILHLLGFDDKDPAKAAIMRREQEKILKALL